MISQYIFKVEASWTSKQKLQESISKFCCVIVKRKISYILFLILFLQSCQNKDNSQLKNTPTIVVNSNKQLDKPIENYKEQIDLVKNFMKWYINNGKILDKFEVIGGGPSNVQGNEDAKKYYVNFSEVEKYIAELRNSSFLSDAFLKDEKQRFVEGDKYFQENPENDDPPYGFDYDRFFFTQEFLEDVLPDIEKSKYGVIQKGKFTLEIRFYLPMTGVNYKYTLKKINVKWVIEKIDSEQRP